jgi:hypothetical protein
VKKTAVFFCFLMASSLAYADTTVGTLNVGNCDPFMCNDSGTSFGQSIDFQQVFAASAFSGITTINTISWYFDSGAGGTSTILGGAYTAYLGYSNNPVNGLTSTLTNNVKSETLLGTATVPAGGVNYGPTLTLSGFPPFVYDPTVAPLLLEIVVSNQDNVANGTGNGFNEADDSGSVTSRAYCTTNVGCFADSIGLVTTFGGTTTSTVPEPANLVLLGSSLLGLALVLRRKLSA